MTLHQGKSRGGNGEGQSGEKTIFGKISKVFELTAASCVSRLYYEGGCQPGTNREIFNRCVYLALARPADPSGSVKSSQIPF